MYEQIGQTSARRNCLKLANVCQRLINFKHVWCFLFKNWKTVLQSLQCAYNVSVPPTERQEEEERSLGARARNPLVTRKYSTLVNFWLSEKIQKKKQFAKQAGLLVSAEQFWKKIVNLPPPASTQHKGFWKACQNRHPCFTKHAQHVVDVAG